MIVCTCGAAALLQEPPLADTAGAFTHILIDEAGQALVPETLIAFGLAREDTKLVLCGDPRQLGPVVRSLCGKRAIDLFGFEVLRCRDA